MGNDQATVKRWQPEFVALLQTFNMRPDDSGDFVLFDDYQHIKLEAIKLSIRISRLEAALNQCLIDARKHNYASVGKVALLRRIESISESVLKEGNGLPSKDGE